MEHRQSPSKMPYLHEAGFALNVALAITAMTLLYSRSMTSRLFRMDVAINRLIHIPQTDLVWGYWALFLPAAILGICIWLSLSLSRQNAVTAEILRSVGGIAALAASPIYWLLAEYASSHRYGWTAGRSIQFYEVLLILFLFSLFLYFGRRWSIPLWVSAVIVLLHYGFWFEQFGTYYYIATRNSGPISLLPIAGLLSAVVWLRHIGPAPPAPSDRAES